MKDRILSALREHGPLTYHDLAYALMLNPSQYDPSQGAVEFPDAMSALIAAGSVVRDEGERAGRPAVYRLVKGDVG